MCGTTQKVHRAHFRNLRHSSFQRLSAPSGRNLHIGDLALSGRNRINYPYHHDRFPYLEIYTRYQKMVIKKGVGNEA